MQLDLDLRDGHAPLPLWHLPIRPAAKPKCNSTRRDRLIRHRTPPWADRRLIASLRRAARSSGLSLDHIVPLNHPLVCGLHVEHNLRVIPLKHNLSRGNGWWPDCPDEQLELL